MDPALEGWVEVGVGARRGFVDMNRREGRKGHAELGPCPGWLSHHPRPVREAGAPLCLRYTTAGVRNRSVPAAWRKLQSAA